MALVPLHVLVQHDGNNPGCQLAARVAAGRYRLECMVVDNTQTGRALCKTPTPLACHAGTGY